MRPLSGPVLTASEMRAAEQGCGVPADLLMERAGAAIAEAVWRFGGGRSTLIMCGPGNNGGDGYVAARLLAARGLSVRVASSGSPGTGLARAAAAAWGGAVQPLDASRPSPVLVDCLFGTGLSRDLPETVTAPLRRLADAAQFVIAADLPSGIGSDDGRDRGAARADLTLALGAAKPGHLLQPGAARCGIIWIADIGIQVSSAARVPPRPGLAMPGPADDKYTRGFVLVVGGAMPGAAALSARAALRAGAGYAVLAGRGSPHLPDAVIVREMALTDLLGDPRIGAVVIGPGLGRDVAAAEKLDAVMRSGKPIVLDADAIALAEGGKHRAAPVIATPHAGEFARAFGAASNKIDAARAAAARTGWTIVFKGADTVIASPDGQALLAPAASPWLSSAGTGDVLAGITGAMLARGLMPLEAASAAVWLHGEAGRIAGAGLIADDLCAALPRALAVASR